MNVLVTGASGFVAGHVIDAFVEAGHSVRALTRNSAWRPSANAEVIRWQGFSDSDTLIRALQGVDVVVHLAARAHILRDVAADRLDQFRRVNVEGTRNVLKQAIAQNVRKFIMTSSVKAVGEFSATPWTEDEPLRPVDPYGITKAESEQEVLRLARGAEIDVSILRLAMVYGPGMKGNLPRLFRLVDKGIPLPFGGIDNQRSMVFCGNVAAAVTSLALQPRAASPVFFVADDFAPSTTALLEQIGSLLGKPARLFAVPRAVLSGIGHLGDVMNRFVRFPVTSGDIDRLTRSLVVSTSKLETFIGGALPYSWSAGMQETARWYRQGGNAD
jgi:nucleoside-diphosphate-sugar epimerase